MAKGLPQVEIDEGVLNEILQLISEEKSESKIRSIPETHSWLHGTSVGDTVKSSNSSRDKLVGQIGISYGVLRRLGFSEEIVLKCLKEAPGIDIDQALDWVRNSHREPEEYSDYSRSFTSTALRMSWYLRSSRGIPVGHQLLHKLQITPALPAPQENRRNHWLNLRLGHLPSTRNR